MTFLNIRRVHNGFVVAIDNDIDYHNNVELIVPTVPKLVKVLKQWCKDTERVENKQEDIA